MSEYLETLTIDDRKYSTLMLPPIKAITLHTMALATFGGSLAPAINNINISDLQKLGDDSSVDEIKPVISMLMEVIGRADPNRLESLIHYVMSGIQPAGKDKLSGAEIDIQFTNFPGDLYPVFAWGLILNIKPFLSGSGGAWSALSGALGLRSKKTTKTSG